MDPLRLIGSYYRPGSRVHDLLVSHSRSVARKALAVADRVPHLRPDRRFLWEAAMLHDIGIFMTDTPDLGCHGKHPYVCHGYLGRKILEQRKMDRHALVCERHVGAGLSAEAVRRQRLPLPQREMRPQTIEERIICYADKFFSKNGMHPAREKSVGDIVAELSRYGCRPVERFLSWTELFCENDSNRETKGGCGHSPHPR